MCQENSRLGPKKIGDQQKNKPRNTNWFKFWIKSDGTQS